MDKLRDSKKILVFSDDLDFAARSASSLVDMGYAVYIVIDPTLPEFALPGLHEAVSVIDSLDAFRPVRKRKWFNPFTWRQVRVANA